jgi:nicotinamide-nucleotide amidase
LAELRKISGADYFGAGETSLAQVVGAQLAAQQATIAVAEACTGGLLGELLSAPPGSSASFLGGITAYGNPAKSDLLGVDPIVAQQVGSVSREVALQMALGVQTRFGSTWGLAVTGIAGPTGGTETKPVGLVQIALVGPGVSEQREYRFGAHLGREFIRWLSAQSALDLLRRRLSAFEASDP